MLAYGSDNRMNEFIPNGIFKVENAFSLMKKAKFELK